MKVSPNTPFLESRAGKWLGVQGGASSHTEKLVSLVGGFAGILGILLVSGYFLEGGSYPIIVASMGASAVLLFAVPHGPLSQPWPLLGGHLVSALIGVTCAKLVPVPLLSAPLAVGLAIWAMYYLRCIHPPGGATALAANISGPAVLALGYQYVLTPVALNAIVILAVAIIVNYPFAWRRYPVSLVEKKPAPAGSDEQGHEPIEHADLVYALSEIDSFIDISEQDLLRIYELATRREHPQSGGSN